MDSRDVRYPLDQEHGRIDGGKSELLSNINIVQVKYAALFGGRQMVSYICCGQIFIMLIIGVLTKVGMLTWKIIVNGWWLKLWWVTTCRTMGTFDQRWKGKLWTWIIWFLFKNQLLNGTSILIWVGYMVNGSGGAFKGSFVNFECWFKLLWGEDKFEPLIYGNVQMFMSMEFQWFYNHCFIL